MPKQRRTADGIFVMAVALVAYILYVHPIELSGTYYRRTQLAIGLAIYGAWITTRPVRKVGWIQTVGKLAILLPILAGLVAALLNALADS